MTGLLICVKVRNNNDFDWINETSFRPKGGISTTIHGIKYVHSEKLGLQLSTWNR